MKIGEFEVEVERKAIKNIHLAVYPPDGRVHISVPRAMADEDVGAFLYSKLAWIRKHHALVRGQERQSGREYVTGENHYLLGRRLLMKVVPESGKGYVVTTAKTIELHVGADATLERRRAVMEDYCRMLLYAVLEDEILRWAAVMGEDPETMKVAVRRMTSAWGRCNADKRSMTFNLQLVRMPVRCIQYVVVHELLHLKVHGHGKAFAEGLDMVMPDWRLRKKELDEFTALPME